MRLKQAGIAVLCLCVPHFEARADELPIMQRYRTVQVNGQFKAQREPDIAYLSFSAEGSSKKLKEAKAQADKQLDAAMRVAKSYKIEDRYIRTARLNIAPVYISKRICAEYNTIGKNKHCVHYSHSKQELDHYSASYQIVLSLKQLEESGNLLEALVEAGIERIGSIRFDIEDRDALKDSVYHGALADAREKADFIAASHDEEIDKVLQISDIHINLPSQPRPELLARSMAADHGGGAKAALPSGDITITGSVRATYALAD